MRTARAAAAAGAAASFLVALAALAAPAALTAQISLHLGLGARYTSTLVHDSIVSPFDVRPTIGPLLSLTATTPLERGWTAEAALDLAWATLRRYEGGGAHDLGAVRTLAVSVALRHRLPGGLSGRLGMGGIKYLPAEESGVFRGGSGSLIGLGTLGLRYDVPFGARHALALEARYDLHRFLTPALRAVGFTSARPVHRVALIVSARALGRAP